MPLAITDYTYEQQGSFVSRSRLNAKNRGASARGKSSFAFSQLNAFTQVQPVQPPHRRTERAAAILAGEPGNEAPQIRWVNAGWEIQSIQPPNPATTNLGRNNLKFAAIIGGVESGNELPKINWFNAGWQIQSYQPQHLRPERYGALAAGTGANAPMPPPIVITSGWGFDPILPLVCVTPRPAQRGAAARGKSSFAYFNLPTFIETPAPTYNRYPRRLGAISRSEDGNLSSMPPPLGVVTSAWGFESTLPSIRITRTIFQRGAGAGGDSQFVAFSMSSWWENQTWVQRAPRRINLAFVESGNENQTTPPVVVTSGWGFDPLPFAAQRITRRDVSYIENIEPPAPGVFYSYGWPIQPVQPPHPAWERRFGAFAPLSNIEAVFVPPVTLTTGWGFDAQPWQPPYRRVRNVVTPFSIESALVNFFPFGWEVQSVQPNHPAPEKRFGAVAPWSNVVTVFVPPPPVPLAFWQTDYPQPPHLRRERAGAIMPFPSIEAVFVFTPPAAPTLWESYCPQPPHPRPEQRAAGIMPLANVEGPLVRFQPFGWHVPSPEPHPRPEKAGAIVPPLALVESPLVGFTPFWMMAPAHPEPHPRREKFGSITPPLAMLVEPPYQVFYPTAWNVYPQPPHPRAERGAAILPTDFESPFVSLFIELDPNYVARSPYHFYTAASSWWHNVAQANDLNPPIDAGVAIRTATFDFGDELTDGVTITSVVSLTCEVYQSISDTVTDPTPAARLIGTYQLSTSPNSGRPHQAVSQLIGTMVGGVTYRLECVVTTSDGQQPSVWTHVYCQTPN